MPGLPTLFPSAFVLRAAFVFFGAALAISSSVPNCYSDENQRLKAAIENIRNAPQWQHLDTSVIDEVQSISRSGPYLNATVTVVDPQGKPVANALVAAIESSHDLVNIVDRSVGLNPLNNRLLPIAMRATDEKGAAEFTRVNRSSPSRATGAEPSQMARAQLIVITREYAWFAMPLEATDEPMHYDVKLEEPNTLSGNVVGLEDKPVEGANITFSTWGNDSSDSAYRSGISVWRVPFMPKTVSGADGKFTLAGVPKTGFVSLNVVATGLIPDAKDSLAMTDLAKGTATKRLIPHELQKLKFRIVDKETKKPLNGGAISWRTKLDSFDENGLIETNYYELGYQREDTKQRTFYMEISAPPGYLSAMVYGAPPAPNEVLDIPLERGVELNGRVQCVENSAGLAGMKIAVVDADQENSRASLGAAASNSASTGTLNVVPLVSTYTDHYGNFSVAAPRRKVRVQLVTFPYGYETPIQPEDDEPNAGRPVEVPVQEKLIDLTDTSGSDKQDPLVVFDFINLEPISGKLVDEDGKPIPNAKIYSTVTTTSNAWRSYAMTSKDGAFTVMPTPGHTGETTLLIEAGKKKSAQQVTLDAVGSYRDKPLTVVLNSKSTPRIVTGGVTVNGIAEPGVEVTLYAADTSPGSGGVFSLSSKNTLGTGKTNKDGIYEIPVIDANASQGYVRVTAPSDLSSSVSSFSFYSIGKETTQLPDIAFRTKYGELTVSGEIVTPEGDPVVGATVYAYPEERDVQLIRRQGSARNDPDLDTSSVTDEEGRFVCKNLGPGKIQLQIRPGKAEDTWANAIFQSIRTTGGADDVVVVIDPTLARPPEALTNHSVQPLDKAFAYSEPEQSTDPKSLVISGKIVDSNGKLVAGATVQVLAAKEDEVVGTVHPLVHPLVGMKTVTDSLGRYKLAIGTKPVLLRLAVDKEGLFVTTSPYLEVKESLEWTPKLTAPTTPPRSEQRFGSSAMIDEAKKPMQGVIVFASQNHDFAEYVDEIGLNANTTIASTDASGLAPLIDQNKQFKMVWKPGYAMRIEGFFGQPEPMRRGFSIVGKVVDANGPVDGYVVCVSPQSRKATYRVATDENGVFRFDRIPLPTQGFKEIYLYGDMSQRDSRGWLDTRVIPSPSNEEVLQLPEMKLSPSRSLTIKLVNADQTPHEGSLNVTCQLRQSSIPITLSMTKKSTMTFENLPSEPLIFYANILGKFRIADMSPNMQRIGFPESTSFSMQLEEDSTATLTVFPR